MIISLHVPKTAGTTFVQYLETHFSDKLLRDYGPASPEVISLYQTCFPNLDRIEGAGYFRLEPISRGVAALRRTLAEKGVEIIHGHFTYHKYCGVYPDAKFILWLREPLQRALSHYYFHKRSLASEHDELNRQVYEGRMSFAEWMEDRRNINMQSFYAGGSDLSRFAFIGITEEFDASLRRFNTMAGLPQEGKAEARNLNTGKTLHEMYTVDDKISTRFYSLNALDLDLYQQSLSLSRASASE